MRIALVASVFALATSVFGATPVQAQPGGMYMWCVAWTEGEGAKSYFYSGFFAAGAWEADRKAFAFKVHVEKTSPIKVKTTCMAPAEYDLAVGTRNAAMKAGPGTILNWEG